MAHDATEFLSEILQNQTRGMTELFGLLAPQEGSAHAESVVHWAEIAERMQTIWTDYQVEQFQVGGKSSAGHFSDPLKWIGTLESVMRLLPLSRPEVQQRLWTQGLELAQAVLARYGIGEHGHVASEAGAGDAPELPLRDARFGAEEWRSTPFFALIHQLYLMFRQELIGLAEATEGMEPARKAQLLFATRALVDALSPANFPLTNPVAMTEASRTGGESLVRGFQNFVEDLRKGQLTHTSPGFFTLGENIAVTPGKVVHETPLFQLIQYTPTTDKVLETPLVIFPPWINRFYILDLNARKSFVRWAAEQGITVFMVSWKSADETMADVVWDDYIAAQIEAIELVRARLKVPSVHTIGYCVAGTTLAATLALLARRGEADKVASATFFTAQVDFEEAGDLKNFVDSQQIDNLALLSPEGYLDGRYLAATFNLLRGNDLIWNYVEKNYLKGEEHPAFDLLHWNGDVTNLPARWHQDYLRDLYRDNRLVVPDSLKALGEPIDLHRIVTPCYIQAGREDHIAPPESVWKLTRYLAGDWTFLLAGSGHIAGVVNPPSANKYQYWTNGSDVQDLSEFIAGATETKGSWWPHWAAWLRARTPDEVPARGKRRPGGRGDTVIEDAPGRYVMTR
ncbi:PHA/PHB synthase family protein [Novosphingobium mangrovi (ex Hu et al. 2023)]|uniref:Alpha/beta fold hydrolase n=1 Tax=Novosphingobium mangrovi (ex Hu et al. 2023) TaxID=2930094 RepID=A0ABT0ACN9_9SPHN|nr:alpha/beta fold hydrolase [Novosphingobium mangrovi (ex Hu et al. 2023)]MCJ1960961.1 alpha/beta fold hydrolase [Novosphingobium mangrovi (ex Hu et al. 2023)]